MLDVLDERHHFDLPDALVDQEFENLWRVTTEQMKQENKTFADENTTEEAAKEDYRKIANRRVRLGLVLAEIGDKNAIKISDEEVTRAIVDQARQMPGREQQVWDYYRKNPNALAELRAPIFEEKVVDFLLALAKVTEKTVSRDELYKVEDDDKGRVNWCPIRSSLEDFWTATLAQQRFKLRLGSRFRGRDLPLLYSSYCSHM